MAAERSRRDKDRQAKLLGLGLDNDDGHVRITRAEDYHLLGGSEETHEVMQEKAARFSEKLRRRGKRLNDLEARELLDLAAECDMPLLLPKPPRPKE